MKLKEFLDNIEKKCSKITYLCVVHMFEKKYNIENDSIELGILKDFLINYDNYEKFLNDYANVIYKKFESSTDEIYNEICNFLNENPDNEYLFLYRLKRISNQDPIKYLNIEDEDMRNDAINRVEDKINTIENSTYYKENKELASNKIEKLKKTIEMVKIAAKTR